MCAQTGVGQFPLRLKSAPLLYYPFPAKTITSPGRAAVVSSAKLAERQGAEDAAQVEIILLPTMN